MKWTNEQVSKLINIYPITEDWQILLEKFPFSTKRGIQAKAASLGLKKFRNYKYKYSHNENIFNKWNEKSCYLLGYLEADGYIRKNKKSTSYFFCTSIKDKEYLKYLRNLCGSNAKLINRTHKLKGKKYKSIGFTITSKSWELDKYLRIENIPDLSKNLLNHYIRGYFDGDGSIYYSKQAKAIHSSFVFASFKLAQKFAKLIEKELKISCYIHKKIDKECWYFRLSKTNTEKLGKYMYKNANIFLKRKELKFK